MNHALIRRTSCGIPKFLGGGWGRHALAAFGVLALAAGALGSSLERQIQTAIEKAKLGSARVGVSVVDVETGHELVGIVRNAGESGDAFMPASNMKLITSGVATLVLGPDFEFRTELFVQGDRLYVVGSGDPAICDPELLDRMHTTIDSVMDTLVSSIKQSGATAIREIVLNDRVFDREYVHPDWPTEQLNRSYCAEVCGLNFHANVLNVFVAPAKQSGGDVSARTEPSGSWLTIKRLAKTVREGSTEVWLERDKAAYAFKLHGTVRSALNVPVQVTVGEPSVMFGRVLADRIGKAGLGVQGMTPTTRLVEADEQLPAFANPAAVIRTPLSVVLERCNVDSDNLYAECLLKSVGYKETGQPGSWANGSAVVRTQIKSALGSDLASRLVMADGSGLSRNNRVTPEMLTRWLAHMAKSSGAEAYIASMAKAGEEGTLKKRFRKSKLGGEVRAKSGYIRGVRSLSGFVTSSDGRQLAFAVLVDHLPGGTDQRAKDLHEDVVEALDEHLAKLGPRVPVRDAAAAGGGE